MAATSKLQALWNHPAGPKTIHFWAPTFKWGISIANIADFAKPPEKLSYPQQIAVTCTGIIWSRYSTVITPVSLSMAPPGGLSAKYCFRSSVIILLYFQKNWNLFSVNVAMAGTGIYQLSRKLRHDYFSEAEPSLAEE
ncbi:unnamed protein product [Linum tenue]|uniref:Mitochondrial pyruvate carrier n=1 Tax=Linum tenue TaxID=586396 RepID=A0AAV0N6U8_9ROSI|nr:unnamed protein product [Linum tenue]